MNEKVKIGINKLYWSGQRRILGGDNKIKLKLYPEYMYSGIQWIGKIPKGWEVKKVKQFSRLFTGSTPDSGNEKYWDGDITWVTPADLSTQQKFIKKSKRTITREGYDNSGTSFVSTGAIILATRAPIGYPTIVGAKVCFNQGCKAIEIKKDFIPDYVYYYLNVYVDVLVSKGNATTFCELSSYDLTSFQVLMPTIQEQTTIANFLDKKTVEIDALIEKDKKLIELLKEKRTALINHAVTKGLDPNVKLKDSGIPWIGEIPEGWEVKKLKYLVKDLSGNGFPEEEQGKDVGDIPFYKVSDINRSEKFVEIANNFVSKKTIKDHKWNIIPKYSLIAPKIGEALKKNHRKITKVKCIIDNNCIAFHTFDINYNYNYYLFKLINFEWFVNPGAVPSLSIEKLRSSIVSLPPLPEQTTIANFLDKRTAKINASIEKIEKKIVLLEEYKKSLNPTF
ncbi:hypothetical protein ES707_19910 [subsurface metagenome]